VDPATRRLLIAVQFCFGVFPVLGKLALESFSPRAVLVWRLLAGASVLGAVAVLRHGRRALPPPRDLGRLALLSLLGVIINQLLFLEGLHRSTAVNAGLLMTVIPVATTGLAVALGLERPTRRRLWGTALAVVGVAVLFVGRGAGLAGETWRGDLLMTLNALSYSVYLVLAKPVLQRLPQIVVIAWVFGFGLLALPLLAIGTTWIPPEATSAQWLALAGILLLPTVLAYLLNTVVLARTHASTTATYVMLQPFIAAGLGIALLGERPRPAVYLTGACVLAGLWMVSSAPRRAAWPLRRE